MAKKKRLPIKKTTVSKKSTIKERKPKVGDTVYKKNGTDARAWIYKENLLIKGKKYAYITSSTLKVENGEPMEIMGLIDFVKIDSLTINLPPTDSPTQIIVF